MRVMHVQKVAVVAGSERHLLDLLPALERRGATVRLACLSAKSDNEFLTAARGFGVPIVVIPLREAVSVAALRSLRAAVTSFGPDLIHTHLIHGHLYGQTVAAMARVPSIATAHNASSRQSSLLFRSLLKVSHRFATQTIAVSDHVARHLLRLGIVAERRITVVRHGCRAELADEQGGSSLREALGIPDDAFVVGMSGRIITGKGHATTIKAVASLHRVGIPVHLVVAGDGPMRSELEGFADANIPVGYVHFLGHQSEIGGSLAAMDVLVVATEPELGEGFGLAALEAMVCGTPVVASAIGALPEIVTDGVTGLLFTPRDAVGLSRAVRRLVESPEFAGALAAAARERALVEFGFEAMIDKVLDVYNSVLCGGASGRREG